MSNNILQLHILKGKSLHSLENKGRGNRNQLLERNLYFMHILAAENQFFIKKLPATLKCLI